jgi:hypothetical protein
MANANAKTRARARARLGKKKVSPVSRMVKKFVNGGLSIMGSAALIVGVLVATTGHFLGL